MSGNWSLYVATAFALALVPACKSDDPQNEATPSTTSTGATSTVPDNTASQKDTTNSSSSGTPEGNGDSCETPGTVAPSTDPKILEMQKALVDFRASLSQELLAQASNCLDSDRLYKWHNTPAGPGKRDGITYGDLTQAQLDLFKNVLQLFLSSDGYQKVDEITVLSEGFLSEIRPQLWDPSYYSIDMFGDPETSGSWGFQLDGHHCAVTFLVHGDNVSMVPAFLGGEPVKETYNGVAFDIFKDERDLALALYQGLSDTERSAAVSETGQLSMVVGPANRAGDPDPAIGDYDYSGFKTGLKFSDMSDETKAKLTALAREYVYNLNTQFADTWWSDIEANMDDTYFVWIDNVDAPTATSQFYYRIYNPYLWVEFNMENPVGDGLEDWNHVHTITRIPNNPATKHGGDYGVFAHMINQGGPATLYAHYALAEHHQNSLMPLDYRVNGRSIELIQTL